MKTIKRVLIILTLALSFTSCNVCEFNGKYIISGNYKDSHIYITDSYHISEDGKFISFTLSDDYIGYTGYSKKGDKITIYEPFTIKEINRTQKIY